MVYGWPHVRSPKSTLVALRPDPFGGAVGAADRPPFPWNRGLVQGSRSLYHQVFLLSPGLGFLEDVQRTLRPREFLVVQTSR